MKDKPLYIPKTWSVSFSIKGSPRHIATFYGFKTAEAIKPILEFLLNTSVEVIYFDVRWKSSKMGRWGGERQYIRGGEFHYEPSSS